MQCVIQISQYICKKT